MYNWFFQTTTDACCLHSNFKGQVSHFCVEKSKSSTASIDTEPFWPPQTYNEASSAETTGHSRRLAMKVGNNLHRSSLGSY